tara:strand:+ start:4194 stop:4760 length:567 start_codon:yes stop_codon:yes gene_type:complete
MKSENIFDLYTRSVAAFGEVLSNVPIDEWENPTPCTDWNIQMLVVHVVSGEVQVANLLESEIFVDPDLSANILGPDPMSTWRGTALKAIGLVQQTPLDTRVPHPTMDLTLERLLGARITDNVVHGWDLSQALSVPYETEEETSEWLLDFWLPLFDFLSDSDHFSAPVEPIDDSASARLLALLGRTLEP